MHASRRMAGYAGILGIVGVVAAIGSGPILVGAADHLDAPTAKHDPRIDITDLYAFKSGSGTALVLNVNPLTSPANSPTARFSTSALYEIKIDTNGDAVADIAYRIRFNHTRTVNGTVFQDYAIRRATGAAARVNEWSGRLIGVGGTTGYHRNPRVYGTLIGGKSFAGVRDDPFFFDLPGLRPVQVGAAQGHDDARLAGRRRRQPARRLHRHRHVRRHECQQHRPLGSERVHRWNRAPRRHLGHHVDRVLHRATSRSTASAVRRSTPSSTAFTSRPRAS